MDNNGFNDWEMGIVAVDNEKNCGYCTVSKTDCIPNVEYIPYIGFMFIDKEYNRLSQQLIEYAIDHNKVGYNKVHMVSNHKNLYEKYGFRKLCTFPHFFKIKGEHIDFDLMNLELNIARERVEEDMK